MHIINFNKI